MKDRWGETEERRTGIKVNQSTAHSEKGPRMTTGHEVRNAINSALCSWNSKHTPEALGDGLELAKRRSEVHLILLLLGCVTLLATRPSHALSFGPSPDRSGWQGCGVLRVWSRTTPNRLRDEENVLANWEGTAENRRPKGRRTGSGSLT